MPSRMERYYEPAPEATERSSRNQNIYQNMYNNSEYTNIEGVATSPIQNEIDIEKIKEMLQIRDTTRASHERMKEAEPIARPVIDEKNYDIRDILNRAKDERSEADTQYHKLRNTQYDILKNIQVKPPQNHNEEEPNLKELIHTITNTSMLNKLGDQELSLNMLSELQSNEHTLTDTNYIDRVLKEEKEKTEPELDHSFYTSSLNFGAGDFEELKEMKTTLKKNNALIKILLIALSGLIIIGLAITIYLLLK